MANKYATTRILKDVRILIGENEDVNSMSDFADVEGMERDVLIASVIGKAIDRVNVLAPVAMIACVSDVINVWDNTDEYCSRAAVPYDMMRLLSVRMNGWKKSVSVRTLLDTDDEYLSLRSEFAGVRANVERPAVAFATDENGGMRIEAYPKGNTGVAKYVSKAAEYDIYITDDATTTVKGYEIADAVYDAVTYMVAALYNASIGESARMQMYEEKAVQMLGVSDVKNGETSRNEQE